MKPEDHLASTWKLSAETPMTVADYPLSCPACGSADRITFWSHPDSEHVSAEHICIPAASTAPRAGSDAGTNPG